MSLHWTIIAGFLYAEIGTIMLLLLPFLSPQSWNKVFKSRFLKGLNNQLIYYFYVLVAILILFFLDAIREMRKYGDEDHAHTHTASTSHLDVQMQMHMRLFRAQRNFYIAGFALFLCLVIKRLMSLIAANATLQAEKEAAMKQAESASRAAEAFMSSSSPAAAADDSAVKELKEKLESAEKEAAAAKKDVEAMKTQSKSLAAEYDRLMEEKDKLERKVNILGEGDKKDD